MALLLLTVRDDVRGLMAMPDVAFLLVVFGIAGVLIEFIRPGSVLPGALGAAALTLGSWAFLAGGASFLLISPTVALCAGLPVAGAAGALIIFARRARRNKTDLARSFQVR